MAGNVLAGLNFFSSWVCLVFVVVVRNETTRLLEENNANLNLLGDISLASLLYEFSSVPCGVKSTSDLRK
jgi:hypothetical protein